MLGIDFAMVNNTYEEKKLKRSIDNFLNGYFFTSSDKTLYGSKMRVPNYCLIILLFLTNLANAQTATASINVTMPSFVLLDLTAKTTPIILTTIAPTEAGLGLTTPSNNVKYINFTSAVALGVTRRIIAHGIGDFPSGLNLILGLGSVTGTGAGARGTSTPTTILSTTAQTIINNIGGGFTSNGNNGYRLTYSLGVADFGLVTEQTAIVTIVYTILDN